MQHIQVMIVVGQHHVTIFALVAEIASMMFAFAINYTLELIVLSRDAQATALEEDGLLTSHCSHMYHECHGTSMSCAAERDPTFHRSPSMCPSH